jgi:hypothetical protein
VSTLEAIADVLPALGEPELARDSLRRLLRTLLQRARDSQRGAKGAAELRHTASNPIQAALPTRR